MNNYPVNPYGYGAYPPPQNPMYNEHYVREKTEKKDLRRRSSFVGVGVIMFVAFQFLFGIVLRLSKTWMLSYEVDLSFQLATESILAIVMILGPYLIIRGMLDRNKTHFVPLSAGENKKYNVMFIFIGVAACIAGSYLTYYVGSAVENFFGVEFTQNEYDNPTNATEVFLYLLRSALIPALVEEVAMRGGVLQLMRKYGDWFAIISSSFVFAVLHGNMVQIPFAFLAGIALGYVFIVTGSLWPCVIIHFINNMASSLIGIYQSADGSYGVAEILYVSYEAIFAIAGIICLILYIADKKKPHLLKGNTILTGKQKTGTFIFNVPMILSILYMAFITSTYIE